MGKTALLIVLGHASFEIVGMGGCYIKETPLTLS
jgi:hypothetical protein